MSTFPETSFFNKLIDDFGIWQHTDGAKIIVEDGYSLEAAVRALLLTLTLDRVDQSEILFTYILKSVQQGNLYGFADANRNIVIAKPVTDEVAAQLIWAMGLAYSKDFHRNEAYQFIASLLPRVEKSTQILDHAYVLLGVLYISKEFAEHYYVKLSTFINGTDEDWVWPELTLTYGTGIVPYAFLRYGMVHKDESAAQLGRKVLSFLEERCTLDRQRGPIGTDGWMPRGTRVASLYSQLPTETAYMVWAWAAAYQLSGNPLDKEHRDAWMQWFDGINILRAVMYDPSDMRCFDSINPFGVDYHSSANSNICFLLSKYMSTENVTV